MGRMPRSSVAEANRTREAIVDRAVAVASKEGLEGLTIGRLAGDLDMSKAGLIGHFGSKERLQLAALEAAIEIFRREVWEPAEKHRPGIRRLQALCDAWVSYIERRVFPGGCFFAAAATEFDDRDGPVRDELAAEASRWRRVLKREIRTAVEDGDLPEGTDAEQLAMELNGVMLVFNHDVRLLRDPKAADRARRAMRRILSA
jgi:AcrR family transcriptional regulator